MKSNLTSLLSRIDIDKAKHYLKSKNPLIFVDRNSQPFHLDSKTKVDVILSPSFYYVRREELPVKYSFQAKNLIPSLFDGIIPEDDYSYEAIKEGEDFLIFAYSHKKIIARLEELGLRFSQIGNIFFTQTELGHIERPIQVDDRFALVSQEGIISVVPIQMVRNALPLKEALKGLEVSNHSVALSRFNLYIDQKSFIYAAVMLVAFVVLFLAEYTMLKKEYANLLQEQAGVYERYNLPATTFQIESIEKRLFQKEKEQLQVREQLLALKSARLKPNEHFQRIHLDNNKLSFEILMDDPKRAEVIKEGLGSTFNFSSIKVVDSVMLAEVSL